MGNNAVLFSGQGAQFVGMGKDLAEAEPACRDLFDRADAALGFSISEVCFNGPEEVLTRSDRAQPGIFVTSVACYTALRKRLPDLSVTAVAGLSLGEWTALHIGGAISFDDTLRVLEARGRFMQEACDAQPTGMLSLIGLDADKLEALCEELNLEIANLNSAQQTVVSGTREAIAAAAEKAKAAGAKRAIVLNVAGGYHSSYMRPAAEKLKAVLEEVTITAPEIPVLSNVTGKPHEGPAAIREAMLRQITETVNWLGDIEWLRGAGVDTFIECGPGKVLTGLVKRIDRGAACHNVQDAASLETAVAALASATE